MDENTFEAYVARLGRVNEVVSKLDPTIRLEAFNVLRPYVSAAASAVNADREVRPRLNTNGEALDAADFFGRFSQAKPSENACMAAAYIFYERGKVPFSIADLRDIADRVGLTIPDRLDKTLVTVQRDGKPLFRRTGNNSFEPTVNGELYFKTAYPKNAPSLGDNGAP